jgi:hypothetical protein
MNKKIVNTVKKYFIIVGILLLCVIYFVSTFHPELQKYVTPIVYLYLFSAIIFCCIKIVLYFGYKYKKKEPRE